MRTGRFILSLATLFTLFAVPAFAVKLENMGMAMTGRFEPGASQTGYWEGDYVVIHLKDGTKVREGLNQWRAWGVREGKVRVWALHDLTEHFMDGRPMPSVVVCYKIPLSEVSKVVEKRKGKRASTFGPQRLQAEAREDEQ